MSQPIKDDIVFDKGLYLDFILDHLQGCKWNCAGCGVDKLGQHGWAHPSDGAQTVALMKEFKSKGWQVDHLEIGPTDFLTAQNTIATLYDPHVQELTRLFNSTLLQTTFLEENTTKVAQAINDVFSPEQVINFFVAIDCNRLDNEKYLNRILDNKNRFLDKIHVKANPIPHPLFNAFVPKENTGLAGDFLGIHRKIKEKWGRGPYHTFSCGRTFSDEKDKILDILGWLNEKFDTHVTRENIDEVNFYYGGKGRDGFSKHYVYKMGHWHHVPILYSPFVNEYEEFKIPLQPPWSVDQFEKFEEKLIVDQFESLKRKPECMDCSHSYMCVQYGVIKLQDALGVNRCIVPKKAILRTRDEHHV